MSANVKIVGDGVAACSCVRLLQQQKTNPHFIQNARLRGPWLLLNRATQSLLRDVFELSDDFFAHMHPIRSRIVRWGKQATVHLPHEGLVVSEALLLQKLWNCVEDVGLRQSDVNAFTVQTISILGTGEQHFGSRMAQSVTVELRSETTDACWIESLAAGWLFLLPFSEMNASLIAVGAPAEELLSQSRLVAARVEGITGMAAKFAAYPRVSNSLCTSNWLACGGGAMSFDPLCGEGVGNAVREAILASAVIQAGLRQELLDEYKARLLLGFSRHLYECQRFYESAERSDWWAHELASIHRGIDWTRERLATLPKPRYRLVGFQLQM